MLFPWQAEQWQQLWQAKQTNRLPHALLFTGVPGIGKAAFAFNFSRFLLCQQATPEGDYCHIDSRDKKGGCHSCRLAIGHAHPNILSIYPEKEGQAIKVDQIRSVMDFTTQSSLQGEYGIVIINPANAMNTNAANALLKTLEEPCPGCIIILVCERSHRLPATVLSRCQRIVFPQPPHKLAINWLNSRLSSEMDAKLLLNLANGAPLKAWSLVQDKLLPVRQHLFAALYSLREPHQDPIRLAVNLQDINDLQILLDFLLHWIIDLLRLQLSGDVKRIENEDYAQPLIELSQLLPVKKNMQFMEYVQQLRAELNAGINLNKQLIIESLLIRWHFLFSESNEMIHQETRLCF
jgi:DNA polymerase-3 subunit delta'